MMNNNAKNHILRPLKIMYWNADGIERDKLLLDIVLHTKHIDIALICESRIKPNTVLKIRNYDVYHTPGPNPPYGGTAVIIKSSIPHYKIQSPHLQNLQTTAISIQTSNENLVIGALYHSPSHPILNVDLDTLINISKNFIFAGDMNSKHKDWNSRITNTRGRQLAKHAETNDYEVFGPMEHTYFPHNPAHRSDVLDIVLKKSNSHILNLETFSEFNSDHNPVLLELDTNIQHTLLQPRPITITNWSIFRFNLTSVVPHQIEIHSTAELDEQISTLTNTIKFAKYKATRCLYTNNNNYQSTIPELQPLLKYKRKLRKYYQQFRHPDTKTELNYITKKIHILIQDFRIQQLDNDIQKAMANNNIWSITKRFKTKGKGRASAIQGPYGMVFSPIEKSETIADVLQNQFEPNTPSQDEESKINHLRITANVKSFLMNTPQFIITPCTISEVKSIIKHSNSNKSPGPDGLSFETLKNLPHICIKIITMLMNSALHLHYFPRLWKVANIVTIPKPGKNSSIPQNRRPISLLNTMGKIYERLIQSRIQELAFQITPDTQFAFIPQRSTTLQLIRLVEYIKSGFNNQEHTTAVFLDVQKAYDTVWFYGLIFKLIHYKFPDSIIHLIASYLQDRSFQVKIDGALSTQRRIHAGVPQGSVIAPILYNIYTSDIPHQKNAQVAQYADDTVLYYKHFSIINTTNNINCYLQKISQWCNKWRIKINEDKSQCVIFTRRRPSLPPPLKFNDKIIQYSTKTKYLGVQLDNKLIWKQHINFIRGKSLGRIYQLYPLLSSPFLSIKKRVQLYQSLILPIILYAAPAWGVAARTHLQVLQVVQNKVARIISGADRSTRITQLHEDLNLTYIKDGIKKTTINTYNKTANNTNPLISNLGNYQHENSKYKMPKSIIIS